MSRLLGIVALIGFCFALAVHLLTFSQFDIESQIPKFWLLHVGIFAVFLPFVVSIRHNFGTTPIHRELLSILPVWANSLLALTFAYAVVNFALFFLRSEGGSPGIRDGAYVLQSHGQLIRELSLAEFKVQQAYVVRGFSGHWLVFYLTPCLYFLCKRRNAGPITGN